MQLSLFPTLTATRKKALIRHAFSHNGVCREDARQTLELRYAPLLEETDKFNRKLVSYQGNKGELLHSWIRYREGFSAQLVEDLLAEFQIEPGGAVLDPFAGSATTPLVAKSLGIDAAGIELLPVCHLAWQAKSQFRQYDLTELHAARHYLENNQPEPINTPFPHVAITEGAFSPENENDLMFYTRWLNSAPYSSVTKTLLHLLLTSILEEVSYTRKDGQYLRWDYRSAKVQARNEKREDQGKSPAKKIDLGEIISVRQALLLALNSVIIDIQRLQARPDLESHQELYSGNTLYLLPTLAAEQFDAAITSPPYCNRYDYTRTYALELAYLGVGEGIFELRQEQLSCTVENRSKLERLETFYRSQGRVEFYRRTLDAAQGNAVFQEINHALQQRWDRGDLNNKGVLSNVEQYFTESTFIFAELLRVTRPGAFVSFVNDNVRYGGEVIPVDLLTTELAEVVGFEAVKVYVLPQRKGNSSQQMGKFGREPLRKSITIWRKPA